jgi:hypothetical protein
MDATLRQAVQGVLAVMRMIHILKDVFKLAHHGHWVLRSGNRANIDCFNLDGVFGNHRTGRLFTLGEDSWTE